MECSIPDSETPVAIIEEQFLWSGGRGCQIDRDPIPIKLDIQGTIIYGKRLDRMADCLAKPISKPVLAGPDRAVWRLDLYRREHREARAVEGKLYSCKSVA
jgi:hypothetical protein